METVESTILNTPQILADSVVIKRICVRVVMDSFLPNILFLQDYQSPNCFAFNVSIEEFIVVAPEVIPDGEQCSVIVVFFCLVDSSFLS